MVKSGREILSNQYCAINTRSALIQSAEWNKTNVRDTSKTGGLEEAEVKHT